MAKSKPPAFQLYAGDFLTDTMDWTDEEVGVHCRLLFWSWANRCGIPKDMDRVARIARGAKRCWKTVGAKWSDGPDGTMINERLEKTRSDSDAFRSKQKAKSDLAIAARSGRELEAPVEIPVGSPTGDPLEGEVEVSTQNRTERANDGFDEFYASYPNKKAKGAALTAWRKLKADERTLCKPAIEAQVKALHFRGQDGKDYTPHPATWLNARRWEDEIRDHSTRPIVEAPRATGWLRPQRA